MNFISKKVEAKLGIMRRVDANLLAMMRCTVYKSIVAPVLDYCSSIMVELNKVNLDNLQKLQNQGMRIILRCKIKTRVRDMLEALKFMSVKERNLMFAF